ncbi:MAG: hypothetical protein SF051_04295 [Elusimicrobiota bacterium]|nr:hypothetical protein [Elusimicrobiota bacterium]
MEEKNPLPRPEDAREDALIGAPDEVAAAYETVRLELKVEELERRLKARAIELETEMRGKERLRDRVAELTRRIDELQDTAAALHREAASSTSRANELEETLRIAAEARRQLGDALDAERGRREAAEKAAADAQAALDDARRRGAASTGEEARLKAELETAAAEAERLRRDMAKVEADAKRARSEAAHARMKAEGHETHIDSLRAERDEVRSDLEQARREAEAARREADALRAAAEKTAASFEADLRRANEETRAAMDNAEQIRREGVESFERARDLQARFEIDVAKHKRDAERLKAELRERADRELEELRRSLDAERARLYADLELERRAARSAGRRAPEEPLEGPDAAEAARREEIRREAGEYLEPAPASAPSPAAKAPPPAVAEPDPASHPQWDDEVRMLLWVAIAVGVVALVVAGNYIAGG